MRSYPRNSPQAAARLVALALIADGHVCRSELDAVRHAGIEARLGLRPGEMGDILQTLCEDLLQAAAPYGAITSGIDEPLLESMFHEVDEPWLQAQVMAAMAAAIAADRHLSEGEQHLMDAARRAWREPSSATAEPVPA